MAPSFAYSAQRFPDYLEEAVAAGLTVAAGNTAAAELTVAAGNTAAA